MRARTSATLSIELVVSGWSFVSSAVRSSRPCGTAGPRCGRVAAVAGDAAEQIRSRGHLQALVAVNRDASATARMQLLRLFERRAATQPERAASLRSSSGRCGCFWSSSFSASQRLARIDSAAARSSAASFIAARLIRLFQTSMCSGLSAGGAAQSALVASSIALRLSPILWSDGGEIRHRVGDGQDVFGMRLVDLQRLAKRSPASWYLPRGDRPAGPAC